MNITQQVRELLGANDERVTAIVGSDWLFNRQCDFCAAPIVVLLDITTRHRRGHTQEDFACCLDDASALIAFDTGSQCDDITVTVPASLIATNLAA